VRAGENQMNFDRTILRLALIFACVAAPGFASAGDGVLEINQSCALVGCFAGDTAGFPVTIAASGSYRLTSNLETTSNGVTVSGEGVQLDLGGFTVDGAGRCTGTPVTSCAGGGVSTIGILVSGDRSASATASCAVLATPGSASPAA
jgi:hypothetical protein